MVPMGRIGQATEILSGCVSLMLRFVGRGWAVMALAGRAGGWKFLVKGNMAILHIDSSPRGDRSKSRKLAKKFIDAWQDTS